MNKAKHTPGQLSIRPFDEGQVVILADKKVLVAVCAGDDKEANAARIVQCVNSYDALVEALSEMLEAQVCGPCALCDKARAALRAAKVQP